MRIALLEDDLDQGELVQRWLVEEGHNCRHFASSQDFLRNVLRDTYDLLILDWMMPDMDGLEVMGKVRASVRSYTPILFITARDTEDDVVRVLQAGADDYMPKPLRSREFLARVTALGRRTGGVSRDEVSGIEPYNVDLNAKRIELNGDAIELTHREFDLAVFMFRHADKVVSRAHILESIWGMHGAELNTRTVDTHISRLRKKLVLTPANGWQLAAIYQHGYRLERAAADEVNEA